MSIGASVSLSQDVPTDVDTNLSVFAQRYGDNGKAVYSVAGLSYPAEDLLTISHEVTKAGNQRHLIRRDKTKVDANLVPATASCYLVIDRPPSTAISEVDINYMIGQLVDFIIEGGGGTRIAQILNNEV